jgi:5'-methylthioadenosine phosphorylase
VTDYDCWHPDHDHVTVEMVVDNVHRNAEMAQRVIANAVESLPVERSCGCVSALASAIMTRPDAIPEQTRRDLEIIVGKYLK